MALGNDKVRYGKKSDECDDVDFDQCDDCVMITFMDCFWKCEFIDGKFMEISWSAFFIGRSTCASSNHAFFYNSFNY